MARFTWIAGLAVAAGATTLFAAPPPPPAPSEAPPAERDRGILAGPEVDPGARDGRQSFGRGDRPAGREGAERGGGEPLGRMMATLVAALEKVEPTEEQQAAIRAAFAEVRAKAAKFAEEDAKRLRDLMRIRRDLVQGGDPTDEVDAELATLRAKVVEPRKVVADIEKLLDPERAAALREELAKARREAAERARRERGRSGRPTRDAMGDEAMGDPMMGDEAPRGRDRGGRAGRGRGGQAPPLDLGDAPTAPPPPPAPGR